MFSKRKKLIFLTLPIIYIIYILYIRLILVRETRILFVALSKTQILLLCFVLFVLFLRLYVLLKTVGVIKQKQKKNKLLLLLDNKISKLSAVISQIWIDFLRSFTLNSLRTNFLILKLSQYLKSACNWYKALALILVFDVLPKIIIVVTFLSDIFLFQNFYYFYSSLTLLLLPVIFSSLRAILQQYYEDNIDMVTSLINKSIVTKGVLFRIEYTFADDFIRPDHIKDINDFLDNHYFPIKDIPYILAYFDTIKISFHIYWILIIILCLHVFGWLIILFSGI